MCVIIQVFLVSLKRILKLFQTTPSYKFLDVECSNVTPVVAIENLDASSCTPVASTSNVLQSTENQLNKPKGPGANRHNFYFKCVCGKKLHKNKLVCDNCGVSKVRRLAIDWNRVRKKAPKSASYTTKRFFDRAFQLQSAHNRDIVVLIHCKDGQGKKFRYWASPGRAEVFLSGEMGKAIKSAWHSVNHPEFKITKQADSENTKTKKRKSAIAKKKKYTRTDTDPSSEPAEEKEGDDSSDGDDEVYKVDKVLKKRVSDLTGQLEYFVKWHGWASEFNTWEPEEHIIDKSLIAAL